MDVLNSMDKKDLEALYDHLLTYIEGVEGDLSCTFYSQLPGYDALNIMLDNLPEIISKAKA